MEKNLIPEELDALIQEFLTDDVLTDKERQVILRKAASLGLDQDEIDLYLDAQVQKIDQATETAARRMKSKECPHCQAPVPQFTDKCPECGRYITPQANEELKDILENLEEALVDLKAGTDFQRSKATVERYSRKGKMYYGNNPKVQILLKEVEYEMAIAEKKAKSQAIKKTLTTILTNKYFLLVLVVVIGVICFYVCDSKEKVETDSGLGYLLIGMLCVSGGIIGIIACFSSDNEKRKQEAEIRKEEARAQRYNRR